jgi:hypothetical protein
LQHHITTLKHAYLKLRYLADMGCKFVGHGLNKDFRMANIVIPADNVSARAWLSRLSERERDWGWETESSDGRTAGGRTHLYTPGPSLARGGVWAGWTCPHAQLGTPPVGCHQLL